MIFRIADNSNLATVRSYHIALRDRLLRVVRSFRVHVGFKCQQEFRHGGFSENGDEVDCLDRCHELGAISFAEDRAAVALQPRDLRVRIYSNYEDVAESARALKVAYVAGVQNVEATVGENDPSPVRPGLSDACNKCIAIEDS